MEQYNISGMSCAACSTRVEKAVSSVKGVTSCSVNLLTNSMSVEGSAEADAIVKAVQDAGYGASKKGIKKNGENHKISISEMEEMVADKETPILKKRLFWSVLFLIVLIYFSMGHMMWDWPVFAFFEHNPLAQGILQLLLTAIVMVINQKFFVSGFKSLLHKAPNMDTLIALSATAAFVYSTFALFFMTDAVMTNDMEAVHNYKHEFYYETTAMILTLITVGKMLEARSKGRTTDAIKGLLKLAPKTAVVEREGVALQIPVEQVKKGDVFVVKPGDSIPVDGIVIEGSSAVNEAALTGESIPVDKQAGCSVSAATINQSGYLRCEATRVGEDTTLSQIIQLVSKAAATKAPIAKVADRVSGFFVPMVMGISVITIVVWLVAGEDLGFAIARGISVLVISCPCALGLATPVAIMVGSAVGAKNGILYKTAASLEVAGNVSVVALDKTGTITTGEPVITDVVATDGITQEELLFYAASLEKKSEHPLAKAVMKCAKEKGISYKEVTEFQVSPGNGLTAKMSESFLCGGNFRFIQEHLNPKKSTELELICKQAEAFSNQGKTPMYFAKDGILLGLVVVADVMKEDSQEAILELRNMGIQVVMLTGDNEITAAAIGKIAGVDEVIAGVFPAGKEEIIRKLQKKGRVAMVGDGMNDAPALTRADIGMAIGAGTDIAIEAADVVLMKSHLRDVPAAIRLGRATLKNIHQNLFWAFFYNVIGIPLAAGVWIPFLGWELNPMFGAAAMSLSSFCVISNALRLNLIKVHDGSKDHKKKNRPIKNKKEKGSNHEKRNNNRENIKMKKTMRINGMMCEHCEARVKKTLEALEAVKEAVVDHKAGTAIIALTTEISNEELQKVVEQQDYEVVSVE